MPIRRLWRHYAIENISLQLTDRSSPKMHAARSSCFAEHRTKRLVLNHYLVSFSDAGAHRLSARPQCECE